MSYATEELYLYEGPIMEATKLTSPVRTDIVPEVDGIAFESPVAYAAHSRRVAAPLLEQTVVVQA
jgi:hypothetical protein